MFYPPDLSWEAHNNPVMVDTSLTSFIYEEWNKLNLGFTLKLHSSSLSLFPLNDIFLVSQELVLYESVISFVQLDCLPNSYTAVTRIICTATIYSADLQLPFDFLRLQSFFTLVGKTESRIRWSKA